MISVVVTLSGSITGEAVEEAQDYVRAATGREPKTIRLDALGPLEIIVHGFG